MGNEYFISIELIHSELLPAKIKARPIVTDRSGLELLAQMKQHADCQFFEHLDWQISNHQNGVMWIDEDGKLKQRSPVAAIYLKPYDNTNVADMLVGTVILTGPIHDQTIELLNYADAYEVALAINRHDACRVMGGMYMTTELPAEVNRLPEWMQRWLQR